MNEQPYKVLKIDMKLVHIKDEFPVRLAELLRINQDAAIQILLKWGALDLSRKELYSLWDELQEVLKKV